MMMMMRRIHVNQSVYRATSKHGSMYTEDGTIGERENRASIASANDALGGETVGEAAGDVD